MNLSRKLSARYSADHWHDDAKRSAKRLFVLLLVGIEMVSLC